jgi:predicted Zn finger-like uncharacterized protein
MSTQRLTCPLCHSTLKLAQLPTPGARVRCPRCDRSFTAPEDDDALAKSSAKRKRSKDDDRPRRSSGGGGGGSVVLAVVAVAVMLLLAAAGSAALLVWHFLARPPALAQGSTGPAGPGPTGSSAPGPTGASGPPPGPGGNVVASSGFNDARGLNADPTPNSPFPLNGAPGQPGFGEQGWLGGWYGANQARFQTAVVQEGDGALFMTGTDSINRRLAQPETGVFQVEQYVRLPAGGDLKGYVKNLDADRGAETGPMWKAGGSKFEILQGGNWRDTGLACRPDTWHKVTLKVNVPKQAWEFAVDDKKAPGASDFRQPQTALDGLHYLTETPQGFYLDAVVVSRLEAGPGPKPSDQADFMLTAEDLAREFSASEDGAARKYQFKRLILDGVVLDNRLDSDDRALFLAGYRGAKEVINVRCLLRPDLDPQFRARVKALKPGDRLKFWASLLSTKVTRDPGVPGTVDVFVVKPVN